MSNTYIPYISEYTARGERVSDLFSHLLRHRVIILSGEITQATATTICAQILVLQYENNDPIQLMINSPGGDVIAGLAIYDMMQNSPCEIRTVCMGQACSMGAILLVAGTKGCRSVLPNSRVLLHQPWGGLQGQVTDMGIHFQDILSMKDKLLNILVKHTGQSREILAEHTERDYILYAEAAKNYGVVDEVMNFKTDKVNLK